jgi:DNA-binding NtrC family response regulator
MILPSKGINFVEYISKLEQEIIEQALYMAHGNRARAGRLLYLGRTTLVAKMRKLGLMEKDYGQYEATNVQRDKRK